MWFNFHFYGGAKEKMGEDMSCVGEGIWNSVGPVTPLMRQRRDTGGLCINLRRHLLARTARLEF